MNNKKTPSSQDKPVLLRTTLFVIGEQNIITPVFIKTLLKDYQSQNLKDSFNQNDGKIYYGTMCNANDIEFPIRIIAVDCAENSNFIANFPLSEFFEKDEMGFIYLYNSGDEESLNFIGDLLNNLSSLFAENPNDRKKDKFNNQKQKFCENYGKKIDFCLVGIQQDGKNESKQYELLSEKYSLEHFFFSEKDANTSVHIKNAIVAKLTEIDKNKKNNALIEDKTTFIQQKLDKESMETTSKLLALSKLYGDKTTEELLKRERLFVGSPEDELWTESKIIIAEKKDIYWKVFSDLMKQNEPWNIRKQHFVHKNFSDCFEFYSPLTPEFLDSFLQSIVNEYLTTNGTLDISKGKLELMLGVPDKAEFVEVEAKLNEKTIEKFSIYKKNQEKIYKIQNQNVSNFKFYSEYNLADQEHFCQLIINEFTIKSSKEKEKKLEISLTDGDLKIMAGVPTPDELNSIKSNLKSLLSQKETLFFADFHFQIQKNQNFNFYSEFDEEGMQEFARLFIIAYLRASVSNNQNMTCDVPLKIGDLKLMLGFPEEKELDLVNICVNKRKQDKIEYFLKNYPSKTQMSRKNNESFAFYSEFEEEGINEFARLIVMQFLRAILLPHNKLVVNISLKDCDIKVMSGHSNENEMKLLKSAIQKEIDKKSVYFLRNSKIKLDKKIDVITKTNRKHDFYEKYLKTNFELYNEFDDSELKFFVKELASLKTSKMKNYKKGEIK